MRSFCLDRTGFIYHREIKIPKYHLSSFCHVTSYLYPHAPTSKSVHRVAMRVARIEFQSGKVSPSLCSQKRFLRDRFKFGQSMRISQWTNDRLFIGPFIHIDSFLFLPNLQIIRMFCSLATRNFGAWIKNMGREIP